LLQPAVPDRPDNSLLLRQVNERILEVRTTWAGVAAPIGFFCEWGNADCDCVSVVTLTADEYDAIRATPGGVVLHQGHPPVGTEEVAA
jgi:hypothetical protein